MIEPFASFAIEHLVVLGAGGVTLIAGLLLRNYGRRLERQTQARGPQLIDRV